MVYIQYTRVAILVATIMTTMIRSYIDVFNGQNNFDFAVNMRRI